MKCAICNIELNGTLMGYRRYLKFDSTVYVWFSDDQKCILDC